MTRIALTLAAVIALGFGAAACASKSTAPEAAPAADAAAAPDASAPAADTAASDAAAAPEEAAPAADTATAPEEGAPAADTAMAEPPAPPPQTVYQMLRDVRYGARAVTVCTKIDNVTVTSFKQCVSDAVSKAEAKGGVTDSFQLGADYRAWAFLGDHAGDMREKGLEWSKQYRMAGKTRETYRASAADLLTRTGLSEKQVCNAVDASECPK